MSPPEEHGLKLIQAWMSSKVWYDITYPFLNFNGFVYITHINRDMIMPMVLAYLAFPGFLYIWLHIL